MPPIHSVRAEMLRNRRGATSLRWLRALLDHGIEVHGQVVVCPAVNDGAVLDDTLAGVLDRYAELASVCVVPLGVSRFNTEARMRPHTRAEAVAVVDSVHDWQDVFATVLGHRMVFAADEYYLLADRPFPDAAVYGDFPMYEDGIGMARAFEAELFGTGSRATSEDRGGFFRSADADLSGSSDAEYEPYRACGPLATSCCTSVPDRDAPVAVLTAPYGARVLQPLVERLGRPDVRVVTVDNRYFGGNVGGDGPDGGRRPRPGAGRPTDRAIATCCPTCASPRACSSTAPAPPTCPVPSRSCPPTATRCGPPSARRPEADMPPVVAIVGRPNVGKSTLLNRIVGRRAAIVEEHPGVTRDRKDVDADWLGRPFRLVDTGGWMVGGSDLDAKVSQQAERAIAEADVVLFVVDVTTGTTEEDSRVAELLRRRGQARPAGREQGRRREPRGHDLGAAEPGPRAIPTPSARSTAAAPATSWTRWSSCFPDPEPAAEAPRP